MPKILQQWRLTWSFNKGTMEWGEKSGWWAPKAWLLGWCWDENIWECWNILVDTCDWLSQHAHWFSPRNEREGSFNRNSIHCVLPCFLISLVCNLTWQYQISSLLEHVHLSICLGLQLQKEHYLLWRLQINICYITLKARLKIESRSQLRERIVVDILSLSAIISWSDHLGPPSLSWDTDHASLYNCSLRQQHSFQHFQPNKRSDKLSVPQSLIIRISYPSFEHLYRLQLSYFPNSSLLLCSADKVDW